MNIEEAVDVLNRFRYSEPTGDPWKATRDALYVYSGDVMIDNGQAMRKAERLLYLEKASTLEGAMDVLNIQRHHKAEWHIHGGQLYGRSAGKGHYLTEFEAVAIAQRYLREQKQ